jgi:hypothetical protein
MSNKQKFSTELLFDIFSKCASEESPHPTAEEFRNKLKILTESLVMEFSLEEIYISLFNRFPYENEFIEYKKKSLPLSEELFNIISSPKFIKYLPRLLRTQLNFQLIYYAHVPKTGGTSIINNIERLTAVPTWSLDYEYQAKEIFEKLPSIKTNVKSTGKLFVRSHFSMSDTNHLIEIRKGDLIIASIRDPIEIAISNINYITNMIQSNKNHNDWIDFLSLDISNPYEFSYKLLKSERYKVQYNNILSRTLTPWNYSLQNAVNSGLMQVLYPTDIKKFLFHNFNIENPEKYNETPTKFIQKSDLSNDDVIFINENLIDLDLKYWNEFTNAASNQYK